MRRDEIEEFHHLCHMDNLASILERGIFSHRSADLIEHRTIDNKDVQELRARTDRLGNGRPVHAYACVFFHARTPMLYAVKHRVPHEDLCVICLDPSILDIPDTLVADGNAATWGTRFGEPTEDTLHRLDRQLVYAEFWNQSPEAGRIRSAEVLVPNHIPSVYITGVKVSCASTAQRVKELGYAIPVTVDKHMFYLT